METKCFNGNNINMEEIEEVAKGMKDGKIAVFPTETVYGIGTNALDEDACKKIFEIKKRETCKPLIILISNIEMLDNLVEDINEIEKVLIERFWPGPLTIIFKKREIISDIVTAGRNNVGIRMTSGEISHLLVEKAGVPIVAPSANLTGDLTGVSPKKIKEDFEEKVDYILDCGEIESDLTSTIVKVEDKKIYIYREGKISKEELAQIADIKIVE